MRHWREMRETGRVLYPFGYGLTYGSAELAEVKVNGQAVARNGEVMPADKDGLTVEALVANTGSRDLREVVQVYIKADSPDAVTNGKLCSFAGLTVSAGESRTITVKLDRDALTVINEAGEKVSGGARFTVSIGFGQPDERTRELTGREAFTFSLER